jgi:hypothetical protein
VARGGPPTDQPADPAPARPPGRQLAAARLVARGDPDRDQVLADLHQQLQQLPDGAVMLAEDETHINLLPWVRATWITHGKRRLTLVTFPLPSGRRARISGTPRKAVNRTVQVQVRRLREGPGPSAAVPASHDECLERGRFLLSLPAAA